MPTLTYTKTVVEEYIKVNNVKVDNVLINEVYSFPLTYTDAQIEEYIKTDLRDKGYDIT